MAKGSRFEFRVDAKLLQRFRQAAALDERAVSDWARIHLRRAADSDLADIDATFDEVAKADASLREREAEL